MEFFEAELPPEAYDAEAMARRFRLPLEVAQHRVRESREEKIFLSDTHQVNVRDNDPNFIHLSIKRRDKAPEHDWRIFQDIKNSLCGPETEALELYPAESRLVDTSNQYHLWVHKHGLIKGIGWYGARVTMNAADAAACGARQRDGENLDRTLYS